MSRHPVAYIGILENEMETTTVYWGIILGVYAILEKFNGNNYSILGYYIGIVLG